VAVRDWRRVEARLRARADGLRQTRALGRRAGDAMPTATPRPAADHLAAVGAVGVLFHDRPVGGQEADETCADCGQAIPAERRRAAPRTVRCLSCQRLREAGVPAPATT
jgi:hypothetical protein